MQIFKKYLVPMVVVERHGTYLDVFTLFFFFSGRTKLPTVSKNVAFYSLDTKSIKVLPEQQLSLNGHKESMHYPN